jgi:hypothetical protein
MGETSEDLGPNPALGNLTCKRIVRAPDGASRLAHPKG